MVCTPEEFLCRGILLIHQVSPLAHSLLARLFQLGIQPAAQDTFCRPQLNKLSRACKVARKKAADVACASVEALHVKAQARVVLLVLSRRYL